MRKLLSNTQIRTLHLLEELQEATVETLSYFKIYYPTLQVLAKLKFIKSFNLKSLETYNLSERYKFRDHGGIGFDYYKGLSHMAVTYKVTLKGLNFLKRNKIEEK